MSPYSPEQQELYRAYSQGYEYEANTRRIAFFVDLAFAIIAAAIMALTISESAKPVLEALSRWSPPAALLWLILRETGLLGDDKEQRRTAVTIQEQFDLTFWKSDRWRDGWNELLCGDPVQPRTIKDLALRDACEPLTHNYWVDTSGIPPETAALLRIQQSAAWGAKGHRRYAQLNRVAATIGLILVLGITVITDLGTRETAGVLMAVVPFLVGRLQSSRVHASLAYRRETLEEHIQKLLHSGTSPTDGDVRTAQDELCRLRLEHRRIPTWLYDMCAERDRKAIDAAIAHDAELVRSQ